MDIGKTNQDLISFWDKQFERLEAEAINVEDLTVDNPLDEMLVDLGNQCERILDYGCGSGYGIFVSSLMGKHVKEGIGIDTSKHAIDFCKKTAQKSNIKNLSFIQGSEEVLDIYKDKPFDGIICSNVLDVIPYETSESLIQTLTDVLKKGGYFLLKINFYLTEALIEKIHMQALDERSYAMNGILRGVNLTNQVWIERFKGFDCIKTASYQRLKQGPKDRILLFRKR